MVLVLTYDDKHLDVTDRTRPNDVIQAFGKPTNSWDDGVEKCLTYQSGSRAISFTFCVRHFIFKPEGKLQSVGIEFPTRLAAEKVKNPGDAKS